jgi:hypothetical protein
MQSIYPVFSPGAPPASAALVIAHPAHELRVLGWMGRARPLVQVLTTGSRGGASAERLARTGALVDAAGAERGAVFGAVLDRDFYALVMRGDAAPLMAWTEAMITDLVRRGVELVVTDAWQGYSAAHDLVHLMARLAARGAAERLGRAVQVVEYAAAPTALTPLKGPIGEAFAIRLAPQELASKRAAVAAYPDITAEAAEIFALEGAACLDVEQFFAPAPLPALLAGDLGPPFYERAGEARVRAGLYDAVLRQSHVMAIGADLMARWTAGAEALEGAA